MMGGLREPICKTRGGDESFDSCAEASWHVQFFYSRVRFGHEAGTVGTRVVEDGW